MRPHRFTWLAVILVMVLLVPGEAVGMIVAYCYRLGIGVLFGAHSLFGVTTKGWASVVFVEIISSALAGVIAGAGSTSLCSKLLKSAEYRIVAYVAAALVVGLSQIALVTNLLKGTLSMNDLDLAANTVGLVFGLFVVEDWFSHSSDRAVSLPEVLQKS
jgi:hypothetical protein